MPVLNTLACTLVLLITLVFTVMIFGSGMATVGGV